MLFIPQEVKDKLTALENENEALKAELLRAEEMQLQPDPPKANNGIVWVLLIALLIAVAALVYVFFFAPIKTSAVATAEAEQAVMLRDGKIEKWNRVEDSTLVYRVQLGAYQDFNLDKYKQNIEGLYQDSIDGKTKISLGAFSRLADAQAFHANMVNLGLENVYIVAYENKQPIGLIEAEKKEQ
jgi:hypothetical protein